MSQRDEGLTIVAKTPEQRRVIELLHAGNAHRLMTLTRAQAFASTPSLSSISFGPKDGPGLDAVRRWVQADLFLRKLARNGVPTWMKVSA